MKRGILLINLGTPDGAPGQGPSVAQVRKYLAEFLMDRHVIDIPLLARAALVFGIILPFRSPKTQALYKKIWTDKGSPLLFHSVNLQKKLQAKVGAETPVALSMRYGTPNIEKGIQDLLSAGCDFIDVLPLYPQYSLAATLTAIEKFEKSLKKLSPKLASEKSYRIIEDFYNHPAFIEAFSALSKPYLDSFQPDHVLFSFHGLPERQVKKTEKPGGGAHCLMGENCCDQIFQTNAQCYRAQCFASARLIAGSIGLNSSQFTICFQSRLGRTPWIKPYTDHVYDDLPKRGIKRILVISPSFTADCLETLEEIQMRGLEQFREAGGEDLKLVPSLNSEDVWVDAIQQILK